MKAHNCELARLERDIIATKAARKKIRDRGDDTAEIDDKITTLQNQAKAIRNKGRSSQ